MAFLMRRAMQMYTGFLSVSVIQANGAAFYTKYRHHKSMENFDICVGASWFGLKRASTRLPELLEQPEVYLKSFGLEWWKTNLSKIC
jgi:hypothetical protein